MKKKIWFYLSVLIICAVMMTTMVACKKKTVNQPVKKFDSNILNQYGKKLTEAFVPDIDIDKKAYFQIELYSKEGENGLEKRTLISGYEDFLNKEIDILVEMANGNFLYYNGEAIYSYTTDKDGEKKYEYKSISYGKFLDTISLIPSKWLKGFNIEDYNHSSITYNGKNKKSRYDFREIYLNAINQILFAIPGLIQIPGFGNPDDLYSDVFSGDSYYDVDKDEIYLKGKGIEIKEFNMFELNILPFISSFKERGYKFVHTEQKLNSSELNIKFFAEREVNGNKENETFALRVPNFNNIFSEQPIAYEVPELVGFEERGVISTRQTYDVEIKNNDGTIDNCDLNLEVNASIDSILDFFSRTINKKVEGSIIEQIPVIEADVYNLINNRDDINLRLQLATGEGKVITEIVYDQVKYNRNYIHIIVEKEMFKNILEGKDSTIDYDVFFKEEELIQIGESKYFVTNIDINIFVKMFPIIDISNELIGAIMGLDFNGAVASLPTYLEKIELLQRVAKRNGEQISIDHKEFVELVNKYKLDRGLVRLFKYYPLDKITLSPKNTVDFIDTNYDKNKLLKEITKIFDQNTINNTIEINEDIDQFLEMISNSEDAIFEYSYKNDDGIEKTTNAYVIGYKKIDDEYAYIYLSSVGSQTAFEMNKLIYEDLVVSENAFYSVPSGVVIKVKKVI